jgi:hypothetical protein
LLVHPIVPNTFTMMTNIKGCNLDIA